MKHLKLIYLVPFACILMALTANAQNERKFIRQGNKIYEKALADTTKLDTVAFSQAEVAYRKALEKRPDDMKWQFNLGDALYKQKNAAQAASTFEEIAKKSTDKMEKAKAYHNLGNSLLVQNKLDESIEAYKNALRQNPIDLETKYNLLFAMNLKKKQDQQKQNQQQNKDQNKKDQNKDQNKDNKDQNKDQNKDKQDQNKNQNKDQDQQQQNQQQQQQQQKISKENAERLLQALQNDEEKIQEKVKKAKAERAQERKTEKDW